MKAAILTIGDELLIGQVVNTNAAWIGSELTALGVQVLHNLTVGDEKAELTRALDFVSEKADLIITTGGLGPTHDDVTKEVVSEYFGAPLVQDDAILAIVERRYVRRGIPMPPSNTGQALVPQGFEAIVNTAGSAPALIRRHGGKMVVVLPGVPHEMKLFMTQNVLPAIRETTESRSRCQKTLLVVGLGESSLQQELDGIEALLDETRSLAFLPNLQHLRLRLTTTGTDAPRRLQELEDWIRARASKWIYGEGDTTLEAVVGRILLDSGATIAVAESCTGGMIAHTLTNVPGSSAYVLGGVVAYSNEMKEQVLGVSPSILQSHGAVSRETACEMAKGIRHVTGSTIGLATTGVMGPDGGTEEKPVGTVWIGISMGDKTFAVKQLFGKDRLRNKERVVSAALNLVRRTLLRLDD